MIGNNTDINHIKDKVNFFNKSDVKDLYLYNEATREYKPITEHERDILLRYNSLQLDALNSIKKARE